MKKEQNAVNQEVPEVIGSDPLSAPEYKSPKQLCQESFLAIFPDRAYNISVTCKEVGIDRHQYYEWCKEPDFLRGIEAAKQAKIDRFEQDLLTQSGKNNAISTIFALKTLGKDRGYEEKHNPAVEIGEINIKITKKEGEIKNEETE